MGQYLLQLPKLSMLFRPLPARSTFQPFFWSALFDLFLCWFNHVQPSVFSPHGSHMFPTCFPHFPTCSRPFPPECSPSFPTIPLHFPPFSPAVSTSARPCISRSPGSCWPSRRMAHCFADRGQNWSRIYHYSMVNILMINIWLVNDD